MMRRVALLVPVLVALASNGCATDPTQGYSAMSTFRDDVTAIAVPIFVNDGFQRNVEFLLTDAVIKEIQARTPYTISSSARADSILLGRITETRLQQLSKSRVTGLSEEEMKDFTDKDFKLIEATALFLLNNGKKGDVKEMNNPDSGFRGTLKVVSIESWEEDFTSIDCRTLQMDTYRDGDRLKTVNRTFCKEEGGGWDFDDQ